MLSSPIIRVSRKRTADPRSALVVEVKRQKHDQLFFSLFKTSDAPEISNASSTNPVIDFQNTAPLPEDEQSNPLAFATYSVNEIGGPEPTSSKTDTEMITVNGRPLIPVETKDDMVYDFYKIVKGEIDGEGFDDWNMRFATKEEEMLVFDKDDDSEDHADDDDDSNDENNWRNDYPDEDEEFSDKSESDREPYDEYDSQCSSDDGLRLRMQRFGLGREDECSDDDDC